MAKMTAKEYADYVDADVRSVRRWMKNGLLKFERPRGHHARLIDSSQPRPKVRPKKRVDNGASSNIAVGQASCEPISPKFVSSELACDDDETSQGKRGGLVLIGLIGLALYGYLKVRDGPRLNGENQAAPRPEARYPWQPWT